MVGKASDSRNEVDVLNELRKGSKKDNNMRRQNLSLLSSQTAQPRSLTVGSVDASSSSVSGGQVNPEIRPTIDYGSIGLITQILNLAAPGGNFHKILMTGDIEFAFENEPLDGNVQIVTIELTQDGTGGHDIIGWDTLDTTPVIDQTANATTTVTMYTSDAGASFHLLDSTSGGGITFPIDFPEETDRGTVTTTQAIDFTSSTRHSIEMTIGAASVALDFTNAPVNKVAISSIAVSQDVTGGRAITFTDTVVNGQIIIDTFAALAASETISFVIEWERGVYTAYLKTGSGGDNLGNHVAEKDIDFATFDGKNIDRLIFALDSGVVTSPAIAQIYLSATNRLSANVADQGQFDWATDNEIKMILDETGVNNDTRLTIQTSEVDAFAVPYLFMNRIDPTPANDSDIMIMQFQGGNAASSGGARIDPHTYAEIKIEYENVVDGREASSTVFTTSFDTGSATQFTPFLGLNLANSGSIDALRDIDLGLNDIINLTSIIGRNDATAFEIIFNGVGGAGDTKISSNTSDDDRIDFYANNINSFATTYDSGSAKALVGLPVGSNAFFAMFDHFMIWNQMTEPIDALVGNSQGDVFFDNSTDPPVLKIKKKNAIGGVSVVSLEGGGGGIPDKIEEGNSSVEVIDLGAGSIDFVVDGFEEGNFESGNFNVAGNINMTGTGLELDVNGNLIRLDADGDTFITMSTDDQVRWTIANVTDALEFRTNGQIKFGASGMNHDLIPAATSLTIDTGALTDSIIMSYFGDADKKYTFNQGHMNVISDTQAFLLQSLYNPTTPADDNIFASYAHNFKNSVGTEEIWGQLNWNGWDVTNGTEASQLKLLLMNAGQLTEMFRFGPAAKSSITPAFELYEDDGSPSTGTIGQIDFYGNNGVGTRHQFAGIFAQIDTLTNGAEDGALFLTVESDGGSENMIVMEGGAGTPKIGFFGVTPVVRQTLAASPSATQISTVLRNFGLTTT